MRANNRKKKALRSARLIEGKCIVCGALCQHACPAQAIAMNPRSEPVVDPKFCTGCGECVKVCPAEALELVTTLRRSRRNGAPAPGEAPEFESWGQLPREDARGVWVFIEQNQGQVHPVSWELLGIGRNLACDLAVELSAFVLGATVTDLAQQAIGYGAGQVYVVDDPVLARYRTAPYLRATVGLIRKHQPEIVLIGATSLGRDLAGAVATQLETGLTADCTALSIDTQRRLLEQTRPAFGGNIMATIITETARPQMASVRPAVMPCPPFEPGRTGPIIWERFHFSEDEITTRILDVVPLAGEGRADLATADVIVSGGRGLVSAENFFLLDELAEVLGGVVGGSRGAVFEGWLPHVRQVGQTGQTVRPKLYIACGISGAIQHLVGMQESEHILAINTDASAPIFEVADLGIVGDALEIVPALTAELRAVV